MEILVHVPCPPKKVSRLCQDGTFTQTFPISRFFCHVAFFIHFLHYLLITFIFLNNMASSNSSKTKKQEQELFRWLLIFQTNKQLLYIHCFYLQSPTVVQAELTLTPTEYVSESPPLAAAASSSSFLGHYYGLFISWIYFFFLI